MQIDWLTVLAQAVNFLVLVFLLRRFLYRPVLEAMRQREQRIAERLNQAAERETAAAQQADDYAHRVAQVEERREEMLAQARQAAEEERGRRLAEARTDIEAAEQRWREDLAREQQDFFVDLRQEIADLTQAVARKTLAELADADLEAQMVRALLARLGALDQSELAQFADRDGVTVRTTLALAPARQDEVTQALRAHLGEQTPVHFEQTPDLLCGIELRSSGRRIGWSAADFLEPLQTRLRDRLAGVRQDGAARVETV